LKAPRVITHLKRLRECEDSVRFFCESARGLGPHLGTLLFQLPPNFKVDVSRLEGVLKHLPTDMRAAFEFRHESWLNDDVYGVLEQYHAALCVADFGDKTTPLRATAGHGYFRLRDEGYTPADLERWAMELISHAARWEDVFVYFKHEEEGKGPEFAGAFVDVLKRHGVSVA
jgi:uncharacterized protein YecE (DUF72 family)